MNKKQEFILVVFAIFTLGFVVGVLITLPFAFLGWLVLSFIGIFTTVATTYFNCTITGLFIAIIAGLLSK